MVKVELRDGEYVATLWAAETEVAGQFRLDNNPFWEHANLTYADLYPEG